MSSTAPGLETLVKNMEVLYELAEELDCEAVIPASELKVSFARSLATSSLLCSIAPGLFLMIKAFDVGRNAIKIIKNKAANEKANAVLVPLHQEIALKIQEENLQLREDMKKLVKELEEAKKKDIDNQHQIQVLKQRIERGQKIIAKYNAAFAAG